MALEATQGNVDAAVELLIQQGPAAAAGSAGSGQRSTRDQHARDQRARAAEDRLRGDPLSSMRTGGGGSGKSKGTRSTAASAAAASRAGESGGVELLLQSTSERLAPHPKAVDTLAYALNTIIKNPKVQKYRELKMTNKSFAESIGSAGPAAIYFLAAVGFEASGEWQVLKDEDTVRLWLGKSALETVQQSPQYLVAKDDLLFQKAMEASKRVATEEETIRRAKFERLVPPPTTPGAAGTTVIRVFVGPSNIERKFASDESLMKIVWWLGAEQSSVMPDKLKDNVWELVDVTLNPSRVVDVNLEGEKTLHAMGFWPSAELRVQAAGTEKRKLELQG